MYDQDPQFAQTAFLARIFEFLEVACLLSTFLNIFLISKPPNKISLLKSQLSGIGFFAKIFFLFWGTDC